MMRLMMNIDLCTFFFFKRRRRHTRFDCDWSSDVCSSDLGRELSRAVNPKKSAFQTLLPAALSFIPVAGPALAIAAGAYGGVSQARHRGTNQLMGGLRGALSAYGAGKVTQGVAGGINQAFTPNYIPGSFGEGQTAFQAGGLRGFGQGFSRGMSSFNPLQSLGIGGGGGTPGTPGAPGVTPGVNAGVQGTTQTGGRFGGFGRLGKFGLTSMAFSALTPSEQLKFPELPNVGRGPITPAGKAAADEVSRTLGSPFGEAFAGMSEKMAAPAIAQTRKQFEQMKAETKARFQAAGMGKSGQLMEELSNVDELEARQVGDITTQIAVNLAQQEATH